MPFAIFFPSSKLAFLCLLFSLVTSLPVCSQHQVQGTVIDSLSSAPVPDVYIRTRHGATISDSDGNFSLLVSSGDTVYFSHTSYCALAINVDFKIHNRKIMIAMRQQVRLLDEVKVYSYLSERAFKQKIIETVPHLSREEALAAINSKIISYLARFAPTAPMNANDNYVDYMKGPQGVVIFSSNPSQGLIRALKNVISPPATAYKKFFHADSLVKGVRMNH